MCSGTLLVVQWLRLHPSTAGGKGSIPSLGTNILHATGWGKKKKRERTYLESPHWHGNGSLLVVERGCTLPCAPTRARWKLQTQLSTESAFQVPPRARWVPHLSLNRAHLLSLWRWQQLQLRELFIHMLKHINYFSIYQKDVTKITSHHFAIDDWKHKITEIMHFKLSLFFDSL